MQKPPLALWQDIETQKEKTEEGSEETKSEVIAMANPGVGVHSHLEQDVKIRKIGASDIVDAIKLGIEDFNAKPSHLFLLGLIYPVAGFFGAAWALDEELLPLLLPIVGGYALMGPFVATILYRISRRREQGRDFPWSDALTKLTGPNARTIGVLGLGLLVVFLSWLVVAQAIFEATFASVGYNSMAEFIGLVFTTSEGWTLLLVGNGVGFLFALLVLATNVISFPMAIDLEIGPIMAVRTSVRAALANPAAMLLWGFIIVASMILGALLLLVGLAVVLPVLGHASWHVYRKVIEH